MPSAQVGKVRIEYDTFGRRDGEPLLLIMGLGAQMILWDEEFCGMLADRGYFVIRYDNRDVGRSTRLEGLRAPPTPRLIGAALAGVRLRVPYTVGDMAGDALGLLDALDTGPAHLVGASMGGMIAQQAAIQAPTRVRSLTSIMSSTGSRRDGIARPRALRALLGPPPSTVEQAMDRMEAMFRVIGSPGFPFDRERIRQRAARSFERGSYPPGFRRQFAAVLASGSRRAGLERVRVPALVVHGADDPLIPVSAGRATARAIAGSELRVVRGMGHDLPAPLWPSLAEGIHRNAQRAGSLV